MKHKKRSAAFPLQPNEAEYCNIDGKKKRKYATDIDAELARPAPDLGQYVCPTCGYWHNGSSDRKSATLDT